MDYQYFPRHGEFGSFIEPSRSWRTSYINRNWKEVANDKAKAKAMATTTNRSKTLSDEVDKYLLNGGEIQTIDGFVSVRDKRLSIAVPDANRFIRMNKFKQILSLEKRISKNIGKGYYKTEEFCTMARCSLSTFWKYKKALDKVVKLGQVIMIHKSEVKNIRNLMRSIKMPSGLSNRG